MQDKDANDQDLSSELTLADSSPSQNPSISKNDAKLLRIAKSFSGPIPSPETLKAYDIVESGLAREIFDLAKTQANHRMELEKAVVFGDIQRSWAGLILGFIIVCFLSASGTYLILNGHDLAGGLFASVDIAALVGVFVYGASNRRQELAQKRKDLLGNSDNS